MQTISKMLELATHPTASAGDRDNALRLMRAKADKAGGFDRLLKAGEGGNAVGEHYWRDRWFDSEAANRKLREEIVEANFKVADLGKRLSGARAEVNELKARHSINHADTLTEIAALVERALKPDASFDADPSTSLDPEIATHGGISIRWRSIGLILQEARNSGFKGVDNTMRKRLERLTAAGRIDFKRDEYDGVMVWKTKT